MQTKAKQPKNPVGRPPEMKDGKRRNIYIGSEDWEIAEKIGRGEPSSGIRMALRIAAGILKISK